MERGKIRPLFLYVGILFLFAVPLIDILDFAYLSDTSYDISSILFYSGAILVIISFFIKGDSGFGAVFLKEKRRGVNIISNCLLISGIILKILIIYWHLFEGLAPYVNLAIIGGLVLRIVGDREIFFLSK